MDAVKNETTWLLLIMNMSFADVYRITVEFKGAGNWTKDLHKVYTREMMDSDGVKITGELL